VFSSPGSQRAVLNPDGSVLLEHRFSSLVEAAAWAKSYRQDLAAAETVTSSADP
jgi:hypothetical protein